MADDVIKIDINTKPIEEALAKLTRPSAPLMEEIAGILVESADQAFEDEKDPVTGQPWVPLSEVYAAMKAAKGYSDKILQRGGLLALIQSDSNETEAIAGSPEAYAAAHNLGYEEGGIPQRRFLGIDKIAEEEILDAINAHLSKAFE
ncbi:phage virion morphogenesis protein [Ignatzschineria rhizosphaerae]|uniref:Phage virion morphogenesis protein n=1 Tax=Ignatzschineria rhizosphaerae TaxID=2923279 RepID=A0ABY3X057_9GAMM|nr:phage virion morphogenesis protein [Ignatzschineria rhizosphaerae]UNM95675.1 phage virion morphogenesis protein [Ignatzschineria rhizosphaerae]